MSWELYRSAVDQAGVGAIFPKRRYLRDMPADMGEIISGAGRAFRNLARPFGEHKALLPLAPLIVPLRAVGIVSFAILRLADRLLPEDRAIVSAGIVTGIEGASAISRRTLAKKLKKR